MPRNAKLFLSVLTIWFLSLGGVLQAQQEKRQGDNSGAGQSSPEYNSYMGGKEHYLTDSPNYMAGKEHYLQGRPSSASKQIGRENAPPISASKRGMESGEGKKSGDEGKPEIQININVNPEYPANDYGVMYLPVIPPRHHRGPVNPPPPHVRPNPPQKGAVNPGGGGGFQQGTMNLR